MTKVSIDSNLYERARQAAEKAGFSRLGYIE